MARTKKIDDGLIRDANSNDYHQIVAIEQKANVTPWSDQNLLDSIQSEQVLVFVVDQQIIAFLIQQLIQQEANLLHLAVDPDNQSQGIGRKLLSAWLTNLPDRVDTVWLEVRESNQIAQSLYLSAGFHFRYTRENYYRLPSDKGRENALVFSCQR